MVFCQLGTVLLLTSPGLAIGLVWIHAFTFDPEQARRHFEPAIRAAEERGRRAVLSCEHLSGRATPASHRSKEVGERLARSFPDARILIVIREQRSAILSWYREATRSGNH